MKDKIEAKEKLLLYLVAALILTIAFTGVCIFAGDALFSQQDESDVAGTINDSEDTDSSDEERDVDSSVNSNRSSAEFDISELELYDSSNDRGFGLDYTDDYDGLYAYWEGEHPDAYDLDAWATRKNDFYLGPYGILETTLTEAKKILGSNLIDEYDITHEGGFHEYVLESSTSKYSFGEGKDGYILYGIETTSPDLEGPRGIKVGDRKEDVLSRFPKVGKRDGYIYSIVEGVKGGFPMAYSGFFKDDAFVCHYGTAAGTAWSYLAIEFNSDTVSKIILEDIYI